VRDYEVPVTQKFKDFHNEIVRSIKGLNKEELASFYLCDRKWNKLQEFTLLDMNEGSEDYIESTEDQPTAICMANAVINEYIDDPHQRLIYEFDFLNPKVFYIELMETVDSKSKARTSKCVFASEELPQAINLSADMEKHKSFLSDDDLDLDLDDYYDEEDLQNLQDDFEF